MAKADRPGANRRAEQAVKSQNVIVITLNWLDPPETYRLVAGNLPLDQRRAVRKATGMPFSQYVVGEDAIDVDSIAIMVWLAKRMGGFPRLSYHQFEKSWPDSIEEGDIEAWIEDTDGRRVDDDGVTTDEPVEADDPE